MDVGGWCDGWTRPGSVQAFDYHRHGHRVVIGVVEGTYLESHEVARLECMAKVSACVRIRGECFLLGMNPGVLLNAFHYRKCVNFQCGRYLSPVTM